MKNLWKSMNYIFFLGYDIGENYGICHHDQETEGDECRREKDGTKRIIDINDRSQTLQCIL